MPKNKTYSKAPITEAIIDIRVEDNADFKMDILEGFKDENYSEKKPVNRATGKFELGEKGVVTSSTHKQIGFIYTSNDKLKVLQFRSDGFTLSQLAPYEEWAVFVKEAKRMWESYKELLPPKSIQRLAVRYVNRIDLPQPVKDIKTFLKVYPEVSAELPTSVNQFFLQVQLPVPEIEGSLILNEAILPPAQANVLSIAVDIDLFKDINVPQEEEKMWEYFETLRTKKNEIFEACITDSTRKLINPKPNV